MAVKLRLMRMGKKRQPTYRVVAADSHSPRDGRFIEIVGTYQPRADPSVVLIDNDRAVSWLRKGAQPTDTVRKILEISGAWGEFTGTGAPPKSAPAQSAPAQSAPAQSAQSPAAEPASTEAAASEPEETLAAGAAVADESNA